MLALKRKGKKHMLHRCTIKMPSKMYYKQSMVASFMYSQS